MNVHFRQWYRIHDMSAVSRLAPKLSGAYLLGEAQEVRRLRGMSGLRVGVDWKYVGRSDDLGRNLSQVLRKEVSPVVGAWLQRHVDDAEAWFTLASPADAQKLERELVRRLQPRLNSLVL